MAATKASTQVLDWTAITAASSAKTGDEDVSTLFRAGLMVVVCPIEAVANANGVLVIVEGRFGSADEDWRPLYDLRMGAGTANTEDVGSVIAEGNTVLAVGLTANFETPGDRYILHDTVDVLESEIVRNVSFVTDTSITVRDGVTNNHAVSATFYDIVAEKFFPLPDELSTARVLFYNDDADCDVIVRVDIAKLTAIS